jgi:phosphotriesterase-related protein
MFEVRDSRTFQTVLLFLIGALLCSPTYSKAIYVDDDAAGANDGTSWENAYTFLQDALADANSAEKPVEILVAQGIYKPDQGANQILGDREATFQLINGVTLKGCYEGFGGIDPNVRDIRSNETILSGDLAGNDISWNELLNIKALPHYSLNMSTFDEPNREDNTYHVVIGSGTDITAVLDGFTITGGCAFFIGGGGGMYNDAGSPTVVDCTFTRNLAYDSGGGMYCENNSNPTLTNCILSRNWALFGGGMYNYNSNPSLTNCTLTENFSEVHYDVIVEFGYRTCGGMHNSHSNPTLTDCTFRENSSGGMFYDSAGGMYNYQSNPNVVNCIFTRNTGGRGSGMYNKGSNPVLINCVFIGNGNLATEGYTAEGGAIFNDSIIHLDRSYTLHIIDSNPIFTNCIFTGNFAEDGGGMANFFRSNPILTNCTFSNNKAVSSGGGIYNHGGSAILTNCTFAQNSAQNGNALAALTSNSYRQETPSNFELINCILWNGGDEIWNNDDSIVDVSYSDIQGGQAGIFDPCEAVIWSEGNIDVDPEFAREGYWTEPSPRNPNSSVWIEGDYHLKSEAGQWDPVSESWITDNVTSPCVDAGDPNSPVGDEPDPNGGRINMGAYGGTAEASKSPGYSWWFETTQGPVLAKGLGIVLPHEHIFTDLRGPTTPGYGQADAEDVVRVMAPLLSDARGKGVGVLIECSSIGVGRNVSIIAQVAEASGLPVVVPTGVYGRANFAPPEHRNMTEDELATLFISEIRDGIEGTGIKAGFIKIATDESPMNALIEKILRAAGRAASETGAAIASHTPTGSNAVQQVDILESIDPAIRFIWVHAQNESNRNIHLQLAARGAYIEFDSVGWNPGQDSTYIVAIKNLLAAGHGDRILLSHDAGWYRPGETNGGTQMPFTYLIDTFIPKLRDAGVDDATIRMITQTNPVRAFGFKSGE